MSPAAAPYADHQYLHLVLAPLKPSFHYHHPAGYPSMSGLQIRLLLCSTRDHDVKSGNSASQLQS